MPKMEEQLVLLLLLFCGSECKLAHARKSL